MLDFLAEFFGDLIVHRVILPFFRLWGAALRWLTGFGRGSYQEALNRRYNGYIGLLFWLAAGFLFFWFIRK